MRSRLRPHGRTMERVLSALKNPTRWSLTLFVSLVLILQSAGASLALCKLGVEESGCCGAHAAVVPSCCSGGALLPEAPAEGPGARERDCTCELFGALPTLSPVGSTESAQLFLKAEHSMSANARCARAETPSAWRQGLWPLPPPRGSTPGSSTRRCAELGSWRL